MLFYYDLTSLEWSAPGRWRDRTRDADIVDVAEKRAQTNARECAEWHEEYESKKRNECE